MALSDITTGVQTVTSTGAVTGSLDTSAMTGDFTIFLEVVGLSPSTATARIAVEDTASASAFSDAEQVAVFDIAGGKIAAPATQKFNVRAYEAPSTRFGAANTKLRINVQALNGASPSLILRAQLGQ